MISPDNVVDVSTAQAPMQTWITKNWGHIAYNLDDGTCDFYLWLLTADEQYTVESNPMYPQFMYYNTEISQLMPYNCGNGDVTGNGKVDVIDLIYVLIHLTGEADLSATYFARADVNGDGFVTKSDARIILQMI